MPRLTVLVPTYNRDPFIEEALQSLARQTFSDFEVLILHDGDIADLETVLENLKDDRFKLIHNPIKLGLIGSLNVGIGLVKSELIARMDSDDVATFDRFEKQVQFLDQNKDVDVLGTWFQNIGDGLIRKHPEKHQQIVDEFLFNGCVIGHPTVMMRRSVFDGNIRYSEKYSHSEDFGLWVTLSRTHKLANLPVVLLKYRTHQQQSTAANSAKVGDRTAEIRAELLNDLIGLEDPKQLEILKNALLYGVRDFADLVALEAFLTQAICENRSRGIHDRVQFEDFCRRVLKTNIGRVEANSAKKMAFCLVRPSLYPFLFRLATERGREALRPPLARLKGRFSKLYVHHPGGHLVELSGSLAQQLIQYAFALDLHRRTGRAVYLEGYYLEFFKTANREIKSFPLKLKFAPASYVLAILNSHGPMFLIYRLMKRKPSKVIHEGTERQSRVSGFRIFKGQWLSEPSVHNHREHLNDIIWDQSVPRVSDEQRTAVILTADFLLMHPRETPESLRERLQLDRVPLFLIVRADEHLLSDSLKNDVVIFDSEKELLSFALSCKHHRSLGTIAGRLIDQLRMGTAQ